RGSESRHRTSGGRDRPRDARAPVSHGAPPNHRGRQALRHQGVRRRLSRSRRDAARRAKHQRPQQRHRWPNDPARRLRQEPAKTKEGRGELRLGQNRRSPAQAPPPRAPAGGLGLHLYRRGIQPRQTPIAPGSSVYMSAERVLPAAEKAMKSGFTTLKSGPPAPSDRKNSSTAKMPLLNRTFSAAC